MVDLGTTRAELARDDVRVLRDVRVDQAAVIIVGCPHGRLGRVSGRGHRHGRDSESVVVLTLPDPDVDPDVVAIATAPSVPATTTTQTATMTARWSAHGAGEAAVRLGATGPPCAPSVARSAPSAGSVSACSMRSVMVPRPRHRPT